MLRDVGFARKGAFADINSRRDRADANFEMHPRILV